MAPPVLQASRPSPIEKPWELPLRGLAVFYGCPQIGKLSHYFLPRTLLRGRRVLYLDGANQFDPLLLVRLAQQRGRDPAEFSRNMRVARAFTCFQLTELLSRTPRLLRIFSADLVIITALPELYFDEDVQETEAFASFRHALRELERLARRLPVAVFSDATSYLTPRRKFFQQLSALADQVWNFAMQEDDTLSITCEKASASASQLKGS